MKNKSQEENKLGWFYNPQPVTIPENLKEKLESKAKNIMDELKKEYIKEKNPNNDYNYVVDIYCKWIGKRFYFCSRYNCPSRRAISPSFESKFARIECIGDNRFQLFFMRHTGQWIKLYHDISLEKTFEAIRKNPWFRP